MTRDEETQVKQEKQMRLEPSQVLGVGTVPENFLALKCWNPACRAPIASLAKRTGFADVRCRVCKGEWLMYVARSQAPHGGETWEITLCEQGLPESEARHG